MPVMIIRYLVQDLPEREGETLVSVVDRTRKIVGDLLARGEARGLESGHFQCRDQRSRLLALRRLDAAFVGAGLTAPPNEERKVCYVLETHVS
jgi:hypothetical protein